VDQTVIKAALIETLRKIQELSNLECPVITGATKPIEDLPKFDSKMWPVAFGMVGRVLGISVPVKINIFRQKGSTVALTIDESVAAIIEAVAAFQPKKELEVA
jgi:hypothetical protein